MKRFFLHFYFGNLATVFLVGMMFAFVGVPSAFAVETSGWSNFGYGVPDFSCGSGKTLFSWKIMDESTGLPAIVDRIDVQVRDSTGKWVTSSQKNVSETTPFCFDPDANGITAWVWGGTNYYDCGDTSWCGSYGTASWYKDQRYVGHIYVRPRSFPQESTHHVSPISTFLNYDPPFLMELRNMPSNALSEGVLTPQYLYLNILKPDGKWSQPVYSISETGTYTEGPFGFDDGSYYWGFGFRLSSSNGGALGSSGSGGESFIIDRVAPVVSTSISPVSPTSANTVRIYGTAQDVLSGLSSITVYIDGIGTTCSFSGGTSVISCQVNAGPYAVGTTHSYYAVAKDRAGNVSTSATGSFTVGPATCSLWGGTIASGSSVTAYQSSSVVSPGTCSSQTRTCTNGTLSGSYTNSACTVTVANTNCAGTWSGYGTCSATCGGGTQSNTFTVTTAQSGTGTACPTSPVSQSCNTQACTCTAPLTQNVTVACDANSSGYTAISGAVTRSQTKSAYPSCTFPATPITVSNSTYVSDNCVYPTGTWTAPTCPSVCGTGASTPAYTCVGGNGSCGTNSPATLSCSATVSCTCTAPWGSTINNGVWVYAFNAAQVTSPASCGGINQEQRTCTNGTLSGSYTNANCTVLIPTVDSFSVTPTRVSSGGTVTVKWSTTHVTSCSVTKNGVSTSWSGTNTSKTDTVNTKTTYIITCDSLAPQSVTVNVGPGFNEF